MSALERCEKTGLPVGICKCIAEGMSKEKKIGDFGEPWLTDISEGQFTIGATTEYLLIFVDKQEREKAMECVQSMSRIKDPKAWVNAVDKLLQHLPLHDYGPDTENGDGYSVCDCDLFEYLEPIEAAREGK